MENEIIEELILEDAIIAEHEPNEFPEDCPYTPIGTPTELESIIKLLEKGLCSIEVREICKVFNTNYEVYKIEFSKNAILKVVWVTSYWDKLLLEADNTYKKPLENTLIIPPNSESLLIDSSTSRFSGAIWYEQIQKDTILLAGVGGIGSYIAFLLGRLKPYYIYLYDPDIVETVNMSGQLYSKSDVGKFKVDNISNMISEYADYHKVITVNQRFDKDSEASEIMICGFDNMEARKVFYTKWKALVNTKNTIEEKRECLLLDGRLAAEEFQIFAIQGDDKRAIQEYENKWLFKDSLADETICSYKQTTFMANMIASVMVNIFVNFEANKCNPIMNRDVPFKTFYTADNMYFKVEM